MVFVDESQNSVDDGIFVLTQAEWENSPTIRHKQGSAFSFADGHVERWHWKGPHLRVHRLVGSENTYLVSPGGGRSITGNSSGLILVR